MITNNTIRSEFQKLLNENNITKALYVHTNTKLPYRMTIDQTGDRLVLTYNPSAMHYDTVEELLCDLRHEFCHVIKSPTSNMVVAAHAGTTNLNCTKCYADIFREYIAEEENAKRFPSHMKRYLAHRRKLYRPMEIIREGTEYANSGLVPEKECHVILMSVIFIIFSESTCFHVGRDAAFSDFCKQHNIEHLETLFLYIMEDMRYIEAKDISYMEKMQLVLYSCYLCMCVDVYNLWYGKGLYFLDITMPPHVNRELVHLWQKRDIPRTPLAPPPQ